MRLDPYLTPYDKLKSKWVKDLHVRHKTMKLIRKHRVTLHDAEFGNDFLDSTPKAEGGSPYKKTLYKLDFMKTTVLCIKKISRVKR